MARDQSLAGTAQALDIQPPLQLQRRTDVVGTAGGVQLPEKPLPLLGIGHRGRVGRVAGEDARHPVEVDTLLLEQGGQGLALPGRQ
ncbi:hypothetical protein D3C81_1848750 [compost metagenome]